MIRSYCSAIAVLLVTSCAFAAAAAPTPTVVPIRLEQTISREDPKFDCARARLTIGRDGMVYLTTAGHDNGYILRVSRDGRDKLGAACVEAVQNATADAAGIVASAHGHFKHQVAIYDKEFAPLHVVTDFLVSDEAGWDAPAGVEAGASGDFYALDHHRDRILRIQADGKITRAFALPHFDKCPAQGFRVCEKAQAFYVFFWGKPGLYCLGFDGKLKWQRPLPISANTYDGDNGGFDVDADGVLYAVGSQDNMVQKIGLDGQPVGQVKLAIPPERKPAEGIRGLRLWAGQAVLRGRHPSELFQVYDLATGAFQRSVFIDHERLTVTAQGGPWTAGQAVDFRIEFDGGGRQIKPRWRVWARPVGVLDYRELVLSGGTLEVPRDFAGFYQIKVTPEATPWQQAAAGSEYKVQTVVEVRAGGARGSAAAATPRNRVDFGRGEEIPLAVHLRGTGLPKDTPLTITLADGSGPIAATTTRFDPAAEELRFTIPKWLTARLRPGRYVVSVAGQGLTCVRQVLVIGPGMDRPSPLLMMYGDYRPTYPEANSWDAPDRATASFRRTARLGFNLLVDRLGHPLEMGAFSLATPRSEVEALVKAAEADPLAVSAEKLVTLPALLQTLAGYGANGISQMSILMGMDAGLPLGGPGFDGRKPDQCLKDLTATTEALRGYPAFRGWSWASNWWIFGERGAAAANTQQERAGYTAALKKATDSGAWDEVLGRVAGRRLSYAVDAQALFNKRLKELAPNAVTAVACPFRNVESYPPVTLANVDESDLQAQWEQVALPYHGPFSVDFYKRPGKRAWGHPEVWNDAGTGDQILTTLWQMVMRGADGVGCSDPVPQWQFALAGNTDDPRISWNGIASVYRGVNGVLRRYGPWLAAMRTHDPVAIVASARMYKIDDWVGATGRHFARVMEAYVACLHAHRPASIVFAEDLQPGTLQQYQAVLLVGQTVEMEPALLAALRAARAAGVAVLADGTCRPELVKDFTPLGVSFDKWEKDPSLAADDHAYWRTSLCAQADAAAMAKALATVRPPAQVDNPQVFLTERRAEQGRYLFVVNNSVPSDLEPGCLWRVTLACASLLPQVVPLGLDVPAGHVVYDVLAGKRVQPAGGIVNADCRSSPARIFAILPAAIARVEADLRSEVERGKAMRWEVRVRDSADETIAAAVPVRVRLLASDGGVLEQQYVSAASQGAGGEFLLPLNGPGDRFVVEAVELFSGKRATLTFGLQDAELPLDLLKLSDASVGNALRGVPGTGHNVAAQAAERRGARSLKSSAESGNHSLAKASSASGPSVGDFTPADEAFGPHVRDLVLTDDGKLAVMNTMNWDHNLYAVDTETGKVRWRQRAGHYFAFEPVALPDGLAVQGFDLRSAQGYHLYLVGADGLLRRRFALYGLPQRLPHRFVPALLRDHINSFAVGDGGRWVATAGDLGLAVWSSEGKVLWQQDWYKDRRHSGKVVALDAATLLVIEGTAATAYGARDGRPEWRQSLGRSGEIRIARSSTDARTCVLYNIADGGKLWVLRGGQVVRVIPTPAEDFCVSADGSLLAVVSEQLLKLYSVADGLQWIFHGDDLLHFPRFSGDGRLAAASGLGTVYVTDLEGRTLLERDMQALAVPAWLADGSLLLATWEGTVCRLDKGYAQQWRTRLVPEAADLRGKLLAEDATPTSHIDGWSNAAAEANASVPLLGTSSAANLLAKTTPMIRLLTSQGENSLVETPGQKVAMLYDGKAAAPAEAWIPWHMVGTFAETSPENSILIDAFRTQMRVTGVTLVEDPGHPESWLRDGRIDFWDAVRERWVPIQPLLSDAAVHTHMFARPVEAARFRLLLPWGVCGNVRLAQIVFHGEVLGCSHPDAVAKRPLAVLFDEQEDIQQDLYTGQGKLSLALEGAYSGGRCLTLTPDGGGESSAGCPFRQQFGETVRNWDFQIAEHPQPGQYRYLQFAWKALSPATKGITLCVNEGGYEGYSIAAGDATAWEGKTVVKKLDTPPASWQLVRLDLWAVAKKAWRVRALRLGVKGGGAAFDQIVLGRTESDLPQR
jgi:outer membrane protein assembly factor BamB